MLSSLVSVRLPRTFAIELQIGALVDKHLLPMEKVESHTEVDPAVFYKGTVVHDEEVDWIVH